MTAFEEYLKYPRRGRTHYDIHGSEPCTVLGASQSNKTDVVTVAEVNLGTPAVTRSRRLWSHLSRASARLACVWVLAVRLSDTSDTRPFEGRSSFTTFKVNVLLDQPGPRSQPLTLNYLNALFVIVIICKWRKSTSAPSIYTLFHF